MRVLVACEFTGNVRNAFRARGHEAISCDPAGTESHPEWHYPGDVADIIDNRWDMMIAFPPCTYLSNAGNYWLKDFRYPPSRAGELWPLDEERMEQRRLALDFVRLLMGAPIPKICIENPVGVISSQIRKPDQYIQPYWFGHPYSKKTCLWLKGLPRLRATNPVPIRIEVDRGFYGASAKSRTFPGIAEAMAEQWGVE